jgi:hypothetical protein
VANQFSLATKEHKDHMGFSLSSMPAGHSLGDGRCSFVANQFSLATKEHKDHMGFSLSSMCSFVAKRSTFLSHKRAPAFAGLWLAGMDHKRLPFVFFVIFRG